MSIVVIILAVFVLYRQVRRLATPAATPTPLAPGKNATQLTQLLDYASRLFTTKKWVAAEKAYVSVLKLDRKNVTAYSHLGIIYSAQKNLADAIECFETAARLKPSASTLQNLALVYYENRNYVKSRATFEKALAFEPTAQRYVGLSRAYKKMGDAQHAATALEQAAALDPSPSVLGQLADAYDACQRPQDAADTRERAQASKQT
jgi:tetratricopeptide (TPR) repeat protein